MTGLRVVEDKTGIRIKINPKNEGDIVISGSSTLIFDGLRDYLKSKGVRLTMHTQSGSGYDMEGDLGVFGGENIDRLRDYLKQFSKDYKPPRFE